VEAHFEVELEHPFSSSYHHHLLVLALVSTQIAEITLGILATSSVKASPNYSVLSTMPPCRNTRPEDNPQPLPCPGFQLLLTSLLAHREAARVASESSQPIAHWEPSSQPELLWDIIAGRSEMVSAEEMEAIHIAVPSPPLSQEHTDAVALAVFSLPVLVVEQSIRAMEAVLSQSQGAEPNVTQILVEVLNKLRKVVPSLASRLPAQLARTPSFQLARESGSKGSLPMDISPPPSGTASGCSHPLLLLLLRGSPGAPYHSLF
jgi:hypothetical protein